MPVTAPVTAGPSLLSATALLYYLCSALLLGLALFIFARAPRAWLNRCFALTALSLLAWVATLFLFRRTEDITTLLWLGRLNFAAVTLAAPLGYLLVRAVAAPVPRMISMVSRADRMPSPLGRWQGLLLLCGTLALFLITALTPLVDRAELPALEGGGPPTTLYGPLFPLYLAHVALFLAAAVRHALIARRPAPHPARDQLALLGGGILATAAVGIVTNALLPYTRGDFRFIDGGPLSTLLFLLAVGYAVLRHRLFDVRVLVRKGLVYGVLLSLVLALYAGAVELVAERVAAKQDSALVQIAVLAIASSFDPLRRFLEKRVDRLLFRGKGGKGGRDR